MPVHAFLKGGHAVLMVQKHEKSPFLADVRQPPPGRKTVARRRVGLEVSTYRVLTQGFKPGKRHPWCFVLKGHGRNERWSLVDLGFYRSMGKVGKPFRLAIFLFSRLVLDRASEPGQIDGAICPRLKSSKR